MKVKGNLSPPPSNEVCESMEGTNEGNAMCQFLQAHTDLLDNGRSLLEGNSSRNYLK